MDLIVEPGAGGALVRMVEAADPNKERQEMGLKIRLLEAIKAKAPAIYASLNAETITDEDLEAKYLEAMKPGGALS